jgi:hypothetical protein
MTLSYHAGAAAAITSPGTSTTLTIPSGVSVGDGMLLLLTAYSETSGSSTLSVTSTGGTWTQIGSTQYVSTANYETNSSLWYCVAGSSDPGATVTLHSSTSLYIQGELVAYSGAAAGTAFVDAHAVSSVATAGESFTTPSSSTVATNDWAVYCLSLCCDGSSASAATGPSGTTVREHEATTGGITAIADNGTALSAGSSIGGGSFATSVNAAGVVWTVAIAPTASAPAVNSGMLLGF